MTNTEIVTSAPGAVAALVVKAPKGYVPKDLLGRIAQAAEDIHHGHKSALDAMAELREFEKAHTPTIDELRWLIKLQSSILEMCGGGDDWEGEDDDADDDD